MNVEGNGKPHATVLELRDVTAGYGKVTVLRDVNIKAAASSVVAVLGANGAGKTTLLRVATGLIKPTSGRVFLAGEDVTSHPPHARARRGFCLIPEGRGVFPSLTVRENLILASPRAKGDRTGALERTFEILPTLESRLHQLAGQLSGGEQQMLALARAMLTNPTIVAVDEASLGLAPSVVGRVYDVLRQIVESGTAVILVEQYVNRAIEFADSVYLLNRGQVIFSGRTEDLARDQLFAEYLGESAV